MVSCDLGGASCAFLLPLQSFAFVILQDQSDLMYVGHHDQQRDYSYKAWFAIAEHPFESELLQVDDGRLHSRTLAPHFGCLLRLPLDFRKIRFPLLRHQIQFQHLIKLLTIGWTVILFVITACLEVRLVLLKLLGQRCHHIDIVFLPHEPMFQKELMLIFDNRNRYPSTIDTPVLTL